MLLSQVVTNDDLWQQDPKAYVQHLAVEASKAQILVQDSIKILAAQIKATELKIPKTKNEGVKAQLKKDVLFVKHKLSLLQNSLKAKIKQSKKYKDLMLLPDEQLRIKLKEEESAVITLPSGQPSVSLDYISAELSGSKKQELPSPAVGAQTEQVEKQTQAQGTKKSDLKKKTNNDSRSSTNPESNDTTIIRVTHTPLPTSELETIANSKSKNTVKLNDLDRWLQMQNTILPCRLLPGTNEKNKTVEPELLFGYTPPEVKRHFNGFNYIKGIAFLGSEPGYTYIQLNIEIASDQALLHYGNLSKSILLLKLINGKEVRLINARFDSGKLDPIKKATQLSGIYYIEKAAEKLLTTSEIDTVRLHFVSGYEDYVIYNVDFFIRQFDCLNSVK